MKSYTGIDIVEISRIQRAAERWDRRFLQRIYTEAELTLCRNKPQSLAVRFAGKEAVMKLLGTGIRGVSWRDIEILAHPGGKPLLNLYGGARREADNLDLGDIDVSLAHTDDYAIASAFGISVDKKP